MEQTRPLACIQCGIVLAVAGGRCPQCGALQPEPGSPLSTDPSASLHSRASRGAPSPVRPLPKRPNQALPWIVLGVGLAVIVVAGILFSPKSQDAARAAPSAAPKAAPAATPAAPVDPNDLGIADRSAADPGDLLLHAKTRAQTWNADAVLVSLRATRVGDGKVNLAGGATIEYVFGKPTGEGFAAGAKVAPKHLRIVVGSGATSVEETGRGGGRAALEPNCPIDEAARKARAAGLSGSAPLDVRYEFSEKHKKAVYRMYAEGDEAHDRTIDGQSCAVLVR
ncbi:MAG TPA: hypothetical protein VHE30_26470 [Polyangiaceae bacterium]|nr:hypothetical protein [Polyangiaceae bacterium]